MASALTCEIHKNISELTISHLVVDIIKSVLYIRGQLPLPLDQIKQIACSHKKIITSVEDFIIHEDIESGTLKDEQKRQRHVRQRSLPCTPRQKLRQKVAKFDEHLSNLLNLLQGGKVLEVVLSLGSNFMIPNEVYQIKLPPSCYDDSCTPDPTVFQRCKQQVFRDLFTGDSILRNTPSEKILPIYIMLQMSSDAKLTGIMEYKRHYRIPKTAKIAVVHLNWSCSHSSIQNEKGIEDSERTENIWVKLRSDLKGLSNELLDL